MLCVSAGSTDHEGISIWVLAVSGNHNSTTTAQEHSTKSSNHPVQTREKHLAMSSTQTKSVLCVGINPSKRDTEETKNAGPSPEFRARIQKQVDEAKAAGYELELKFIAPDEMEVEVPRVRETLKEKAWDGLIIGGGIRGTFEFTVYFEQLVNAGREIRPEMKQGFNTSPGDIIPTIQRMFGQ